MKKIFGILVCCIISVSCQKNSSSKPGENLLNRDDAVKNAYLHIKNEKPESLRKEIYEVLPTYKAHIVHESWDGSSRINSSGSMTVKIPSDQFLNMIDWLKSRYQIDSMTLYARLQSSDKGRSDPAVIDGIVYSEIHIGISRTMDLFSSLALGAEDAGAALNFSLRTIVPVFLFLLPYAAVIFFLIFLFKFIRNRNS